MSWVCYLSIARRGCQALHSAIPSRLDAKLHEMRLHNPNGLVGNGSNQRATQVLVTRDLPPKRSLGSWRDSIPPSSFFIPNDLLIHPTNILFLTCTTIC